jgi:hypothetical protein
MRQLVYGVAASLDGFITGPKGEHEWIVPDSGIDFRAIYSRFDTGLMGRALAAICCKARGCGLWWSPPRSILLDILKSLS